MVLCLSSVFLIGILYDSFNAILTEEIKNEAHFVAHGVSAGGTDYLDGLTHTDTRISIIAKNGEVLYDNSFDVNTLGEQSEKHEIRQALSEGEGISRRRSELTGEQCVFYAISMEDGNILRVSEEVDSVWIFLLGVIQPMIVVMLLATIAAAIFSDKITKRIISPINSIDPRHPELGNSYPELAPLLRRLGAQNVRIDAQMLELKRRQQEFSLITENMTEGFLIVDRKGEVLSYNTAAIRLLGIDMNDSAYGRSILDARLNDSLYMCVKDALSGKHGEQMMQAGDRCYQIIANPVLDDGGVKGAVVITLDATEKEEREQLRREFTSNVSHELKTPLTTIYGIADMLAGGIVKQEDVSGFAGTIRGEAERMTTLINDIIKLSRLDEGGVDIERMEIELHGMARVVAERLEHTASTAEVTLSVYGIPAKVTGAPAIVEEMIYNLAENAIKYNHKGGRVNITTGVTEGRSWFMVEDTGVGIPESAQERVFERFYRVDKSRSRLIGGTGLGLSIVKHAAAFHDTVLTLDSTENVGTTIKVEFPVMTEVLTN